MATKTKGSKGTKKPTTTKPTKVTEHDVKRGALTDAELDQISGGAYIKQVDWVAG
jgi:hypothetical protein